MKRNISEKKGKIHVRIECEKNYLVKKINEEKAILFIIVNIIFHCY